jgi:hypothetical protein
VAPILVGPQQEIRIALDLRNLFTISYADGNSLQIRVKGFGRTNAIAVYLDPPTSPTASGAITQIVLPREKTSTLVLLIPSIIAIAVSSIFVCWHSKEIVVAARLRRTSAT